MTKIDDFQCFNPTCDKFKDIIEVWQDSQDETPKGPFCEKCNMPLIRKPERLGKHTSRPLHRV